MPLSGQVAPPVFALSPVAPSSVVGPDVVAVPVLAGPASGPPVPSGSAAPARAADAGGPVLGPGAADLQDALGEDLLDLLDLHDATGAVGEIVERAVLPGRGWAEAPRLVLLVGIGSGEADDLRRAAAALARRTRGCAALATSLAAVGDSTSLRSVVEGLVLGSFEFTLRSVRLESRPVERVVLAGLGDADTRRPELDRAVAVAGAAWLSRTLALVPSNQKNPAWMAEQAGRVADEAGLDLRLWDENELSDDGFGGILAVGQASASPPRLVRLDYSPPRTGRGRRGVRTRVPHLVLCGKGITFDTGGLSLKPRDNMATMKRDMTGAGVVLAVMGALRDLGCPIRVTGLLACAENSVGASSVRPGDVVRHYGGRTSEVTNTDAEGRLVLADAMAYAVAELAPDVLVDVATLTGAMRITLGQRTGGFFSTDDTLAASLRAGSLAGGEPMWRMPLVDDYEDRLASPVGDADNAGGPPGAIAAALFLRHFAAGVPWAHLDLASVGDSPDDAFEWTKGATGFGARALLSWLEQPEPLRLDRDG